MREAIAVRENQIRRLEQELATSGDPAVRNQRLLSLPFLHECMGQLAESPSWRRERGYREGKVGSLGGKE